MYNGNNTSYIIGAIFMCVTLNHAVNNVNMNDSNLETVTRNTLDIVSKIRLISSTKDSLHVKWDVDKSYIKHVTQFRLRYQAEGSTVVQYHKLQSTQQDYNIKQLHEDTWYTLCVETSTDLSNTSPQEKCFNATTSTDSLSVAIGSAFGAFLALGVILLFVFLAKWQHSRRIRRRMKAAEAGRESYESINQHDPDLEDGECSDTSLQVHGGTTINGQLQDTSLNEIIMHNANGGIIIAAPSVTNCSDCSENLSSYPGSSYDCYSGSQEECCRDNCEDPECNQRMTGSKPCISNKKHKRHDREKKLKHQRSTDSRHSSKLPYQLSVDSYVSSRCSLQRQRSRESQGSYHSYSRRRSHDSAASHQKYFPVTDACCCDCYVVNESCQCSQQLAAAVGNVLTHRDSTEIHENFSEQQHTSTATTPQRNAIQPFPKSKSETAEQIQVRINSKSSNFNTTRDVIVANKA